MPIITLSRELGSRGTRIAEAVAEQLGTKCVDKEVLAEMARQAGMTVDEIVEAEERIMSRPLVVTEEMRYFFARQQQQGAMDKDTYGEQMSAAIRALADHDDLVFVGRGAQLVLADRPGVCHVHIHAPPEVRAARIQRRRNLDSIEVAAEVVRRSDVRRRDWYKRFFTGANWKDTRHYDLIINTAHIPVDVAVGLIVTAARAIAAESENTPA